MDLFTREKIWNVISILVFAGFVVVLGYTLGKCNIDVKNITVWNWVIIVLATFRLTRMILYDRIFKFLRDIIKPFSRKGIIVSLRSLFTCPWCAGVWVAMIVFALDQLIPYGELLVYLLAIAAVATSIQLITGLLSLEIEKRERKLYTTKEKNNSENR